MKNKPSIFIASSVEGLKYAKGIQENLDHSAYCTPWSQGFFELSKTTIDSFVSQMDDYDFAIFVFSPDDITTIRDSTAKVARDNVIFELGLFIGKFGKDRCFVVKPRDTDMHIPSDLIGLAPATYDTDHPNVIASLGVACSQIERQVATLGVRKKVENVLVETSNSGELLAIHSGILTFNEGTTQMRFAPKKWSILPYKANPAADYQLLHSLRHCHAQIISEPLTITIEKLEEFALKQMLIVGELKKVINREEFSICDKPAVKLELNWIYEGTEFHYKVVLWAHSSGILQVMTWCPTAMIKAFERDMDDFLSQISFA